MGEGEKIKEIIFYFLESWTGSLQGQVSARACAGEDRDHPSSRQSGGRNWPFPVPISCSSNEPPHEISSLSVQINSVEEPFFLHQLQVSHTKAGDILVPVAPSCLGLNVDSIFSASVSKEMGQGNLLPTQQDTSDIHHNYLCSWKYSFTPLFSQVSFPYPYSSCISSQETLENIFVYKTSLTLTSPSEHLVRKTSRLSVHNTLPICRLCYRDMEELCWL